MLLRDVSNSVPIQMLEKTLAFAEARHHVLATNIANFTTPGYRARQVDAKAFQAELGRAAARRTRQGAPLDMEPTREVSFDEQGRLRLKPSLEPVDNLLFHDGTNARIEREMARLAENGMMAQVASELLRGAYGGLLKAIRGRVS